MPGGGISFGPKPRDWTIDMNKKERRLALATALQVGVRGGLWVVCEGARDISDCLAQENDGCGRGQV